MKKIVISAAVSFILIIALFIALFTPFGSNAIIKPIVNSKIKSSVKDIDIKVTKLDSKFGYIDTDALIQNSIKANAKGDISYFSKRFDIDYKVNANEVEIKDNRYDLNLNILGKAKGDIDNFLVNGEGKAFGSKLNYKVAVKDSKPQSIEANIDSAKLSEIFLLAKIAPVIDGLAFVNIAMPSLNIKNPSGVAHIKVENGVFNRALLQKEYKIALPKDEKFSANIDAKVANKKVLGRGVVETTTLKLNIKKVVSTLDFKIIKAYINAKINNLSRLNSIVKQKLRGSLDVDGIIYSNMHKDIMQASLSSKSLGGLAKLFYSNNGVKVNLKDISIAKVEKMLSLPYYVTSGTVSSNLAINNLKKLNGTFTLASNAVVNKKLFKMALPSYKYYIKSSGRLKDGILYLKKSYVKSSFLKLFLTDTKFNLLTQALKSKFTLDLNNLALLNRPLKQNLRGAVSVNGELSKLGDNIDLQATTKSLQGLLKFSYSNDKLKIDFKNISIPKLLYIVNQPHYVKKGFATGSVKLRSTKKLDGVANIATNGLVDTKTLQKLYNVNLGKLFKYTLKSSDIFIKKGIVVTEKVHLSSNLFNIDLNKLLYKINSGNFRAKYKLDIDDLSKLKPLTKQDLKGSLAIKGVVEKDGKNLLLTGATRAFLGDINFRYKNSILNADAAGISIVKLTDMLNKPRVLDGVTLVKLNYNTATKRGKFNSIVSQARFLNSSLVENLKRYANFDLAKEVFDEVLIDGTINQDIIKFNLKTKGTSSKIKIVTKNAIIDSKKETIKAKITVNYKGKDYNFKVKGPLKDPSFKLSFSGAVKEKVIEKVKDKLLNKTSIGKDIDKLIPKELKGLNSGKKEKIQDPTKELEQKAKEKAKELFKGLF